VNDFVAEIRAPLVCLPERLLVSAKFVTRERAIEIVERIALERGDPLNLGANPGPDPIG